MATPGIVTTLTTHLDPKDFPCFCKKGPPATTAPDEKMAKYVAIARLYKETVDGKLVLKTTGDDVQWDAAGLMQVLDRCYVWETDAKRTKEQAEESVEKEDFAFSCQKGTLQIVRLKSFKELGEGGDATITKVLHVSRGQFLAMKKMKGKSFNYRYTLQTEVNMLEKLNEKGVQPYFPDAPILTMREHLFWIGTIYETNLAFWLAQACFKSNRERINCCQQLIEGVHQLHADKGAHRDLKLMNVLVKVAAAEVTYIITDFGRSFLMGHAYNSSPDYDLIPTHYTYTDSDHKGYWATIGKKGFNGATKCFQMQDVFALATLIYQILFTKKAGKDQCSWPFLLDEDGYITPRKSSPHYDLLEKNLQSDLLNLLNSMLEFDPTRRPEMPSVLERWKAINFQGLEIQLPALQAEFIGS